MQSKPNKEQLIKTAKAARDAGMTYGQYKAEEYLSKQKKKPEASDKEDQSWKWDAIMERIKKSVDEQTLVLHQAEKIKQACKDCGISTGLTWYSIEQEPTTPAAILAKAFAGKSEFPTKTSFMYCDELDMCFFYSHDGKARLTYSGTATAGSSDINGGIVNAFISASKILDRMQQLSDMQNTAQ